MQPDVVAGLRLVGLGWVCPQETPKIIDLDNYSLVG